MRYAAVAEANSQKRTRPRVGIGRSPGAPRLFSMASVISAYTSVDASSSHSTSISPELARTIEAGSSRPCRLRAGTSVSTTTLAAGRIPSSVFTKAPVVLTFSRQPRHLQPPSRSCIHLSRTGMLVVSRCPQRCCIGPLPRALQTAPVVAMDLCRRLAKHQHWDLAMGQDLLRLTAKNECLGATPSVRCHHDQVATPLLRRCDDRLVRLVTALKRSLTRHVRRLRSLHNDR